MFDEIILWEAKVIIQELNNEIWIAFIVLWYYYKALGNCDLHAHLLMTILCNFFMMFSGLMVNTSSDSMLSHSNMRQTAAISPWRNGDNDSNVVNLSRFLIVKK